MSGPGLTLQPPYERVPDSVETSEFIARQSTFGTGRHPPGGRHDIQADSQVPVSLIDEQLAMQHDEAFMLLHDHSVLNQEKRSSQTSPDLTKENHSALSSGRHKAHSWVDALGDWWWWELGSVFLSFACFIAIVIALRRVQDEALSSWRSVISPNALVSTLATVSRASLMLAVAACISQLKWLYFATAPHQIHKFQAFDDASRGPLGALEFLMRFSPREAFSHRSEGARWTLWASVLTILALVSDPFAQQLLSFPQRTVPSLTNSSSASISTSQIFDTGLTGYERNTQERYVDMLMQGAVQNGLYTLNSPAKFTCTTANCAWPTFYTLGICSTCNNITNQLNVTCDKHDLPLLARCNYTLASGPKLYGIHGTNAVGDYGPRLLATAVSGDMRFMLNESFITDTLVTVHLARFAEPWRRYKHPEVFQCRLSWCAQRYSQVKVVKGGVITPDIRTWPFKAPVSAEVVGWTRPSRFELSEDTDFDGPNKTFIVNAADHKQLSEWLADSFFTTTDEDAAGRVLYMQINMLQTFANIAISMTNRIREGPNATSVCGTSYREETYIKVTWFWLILPGLVVLMSIVLLAVTIVLSRGEKQGLWKSSMLAPLFTHMRGWEKESLKVGTWSEMADQAKGMRGVLRKHVQSELEFVKT